MEHPFTIHRNTLPAEAPPTEFARTDQRRAIGDKFMRKFFDDRDKAVLRLRAQQSN